VLNHLAVAEGGGHLPAAAPTDLEPLPEVAVRA
jgi:hypothetical protein